MRSKRSESSIFPSKASVANRSPMKASYTQLRSDRRPGWLRLPPPQRRPRDAVFAREHIRREPARIPRRNQLGPLRCTLSRLHAHHHAASQPSAEERGSHRAYGNATASTPVTAALTDRAQRRSKANHGSARPSGSWRRPIHGASGGSRQRTRSCTTRRPTSNRHYSPAGFRSS